MKNLRARFLLVAVLLLPAIFIFSSCGKDDDPTPPPAGVFTWTTAGATYTADKDTAFISGPFSIIASKDASLPSIKSFQIYLSAFATGAYTLSATGDQINYFTSAGLVTSQSGTLNITATGSTVSGNFTTTLTGGILMTGTFTNVPVKP
ncbi:MAG TPA: hypothetical protein VK489_07000 [Ferruginibacter sp.]|nr:hypothetical protein [Ferruginibacter sp.]